jgi:hypothetical protein
VSNTRGHPASVVEDGDPHAAFWSDTFRLRTATELREQVLARDATPQSATTLQPEEQDSAVGLRPLPRRPPPRRRAHRRPTAGCPLDQRGDLLLNGLTGEPGCRPCAATCSFWRAGADPVAELLTAAALPPAVHGQVWRSRDLGARIMEKRSNFPGVHTRLVIFL